VRLGHAVLFFVALTPLVSAAGEEKPPSGNAAHWDYGAESGPAHWAELSPLYVQCGEGTSQSPIDIRNLAVVEVVGGDRLKLDYAPASLRITRNEHVVDLIDNGHTIQVQYDEGSTLLEGGRTFELAQYHFHAPSEHTIEGRSFPMEMHLVHRAGNGELAVIGVLIAVGRHNKAFDPLWANLPKKPGDTRHIEGVTVSVDDLLPGVASHYRYSGSLTTPPCSEGVSWFLGSNPIERSREQIAAFTSIISDNNRPTQPLNGRSVAKVN